MIQEIVQLWEKQLFPMEGKHFDKWLKEQSPFIAHRLSPSFGNSQRTGEI